MTRKVDLGALIEANRAVRAPSLEDRERNRGRLLARIGASAVVGAGVSATRVAAAEISKGATPALGPSTLMASGWGKWLVVSALIAGGGTGAGVFVTRHATGPRAAVVSPTVPAVAPPSMSTAAPPAAPPSPTAAIPDEETVARVRIRSRSSPTPSGRATTERLGRELDLLRSARRAIDDGSPVGALTLLDRYEAEFPRGASLRTEYEATRVLALCAAGRTAAAEQARDQFLETHSGSPLADRVRTACGVR
jgi:hypothetical protein